MPKEETKYPEKMFQITKGRERNDDSAQLEPASPVPGSGVRHPQVAGDRENWERVREEPTGIGLRKGFGRTGATWGIPEIANGE